MKEPVRIFRFAVVGTLNAIITAIVVWLMMHIEGEDYITANIVAYVIAQVHNFVWCKYWIFPIEQDTKKNSIWHQMLFLACAFAMSYSAQFLFLLMLVELFHCNEYLAQFLGLFVYGSVNFMSNKHITFR